MASFARAANDATGGQPVLVELFTSEGCSSCPPTDALLERLNGTTFAGHRIIALSEHVTYWNQLGWKDPFSSPAMTERQNAYGTRFRLDSVYTPQAVVNGSAQVVGSDRASLQAAITAQPPQPATLHLRSVEHAGPATLRITYSLHGPPPATGVGLTLALADDLDTTDVPRGENAGRTLRHVSVVRALVQLAPPLAPDSDTTVLVSIPPETLHPAGGQHAVLFAQAAGAGPILAADSQPVR